MDLLSRTSDKSSFAMCFGVQTERNSRFAIRYPGPESMYEYDLFAVINHEGQINNGHYTNFARFQDEVSMIYGYRMVLNLKNFCPSVVPI